MMPMSPTDAQLILKGAEFSGEDLGIGYRRALETCAGMSTEYRTEEWQGSYSGWVPTSPWTAKKPVGGSDPHTRVVRRYITEPEEA